ncbi:MAG: hypothetical protein HRU35_01495 [Rickettsiaceae bacterium]|nr:hypothetical protein [Rickettsiaceae bacterium]
MPQFDVSVLPSQIFWLVIVFGFLYLMINYFITPKAEAILISRHKYLEDNVNEAEEFNEQIEALKDNREVQLLEAHRQAEELKASSLKTLDAKYIGRKEELLLELEQKTKTSLKEIQLAVNDFHKQETKPSLNLASFIVEKITKKPADRKLLEKIYKDI